MKLIIKERQLFVELFEPLLGVEIEAVVNGKVEKFVVTAVGVGNDPNEFGFWAEDKSFSVNNIWELRLP